MYLKKQSKLKPSKIICLKKEKKNNLIFLLNRSNEFIFLIIMDKLYQRVAGTVIS